MDAKDKNLDDYVRGENDCKAGLPHKSDQSPEYDMGYGFEYTREQNENARSEKCQTQE